MRYGLLGAAFTMAALALTSTAFADDDEEKIPMDQLPKAVVEAVKAKFPQAEMTAASKETEDGKSSFEVAIKDGETTREVGLTPEGKITEVETAIKADDLPMPVADAIKAKYPKAEIEKAEEVLSYEDGEETKSYEVILEVEGDDDEDEKMEVKISPDGKILKVEEEDEDDDDDDV